MPHNKSNGAAKRKSDATVREFGEFPEFDSPRLKDEEPLGASILGTPMEVLGQEEGRRFINGSRTERLRTQALRLLGRQAIIP